MSPARARLWRQTAAYSPLSRVERSLFAWEWLRRSTAYRRAWLTAARRGLSADADAARFGLVALEDPRRDARAARPIWRAAVDHHVVSAEVTNVAMLPADLFDIRDIQFDSRVSVDSDEIEHWRLGDERWSVRLDILTGTLLGGPSPLRYNITGLSSSLPRLDGVRQLVTLAAGHPRMAPLRAAQRARWITELRVADALRMGASHQEIARGLFPAALRDNAWRGQHEDFRTRVQRLVRTARRRLQDPLATEWFR